MSSLSEIFTFLPLSLFEEDTDQRFIPKSYLELLGIGDKPIVSDSQIYQHKLAEMLFPGSHNYSRSTKKGWDIIFYIHSVVLPIML